MGEGGESEGEGKRGSWAYRGTCEKGADMEMQTLIIDECIDYIIRSRRRLCSRMVNLAGTLQMPSLLWVH